MTYASLHDVVAVQWLDGQADKHTRRVVIRHHVIDNKTGNMVETETELTLFATAPIQLIRVSDGQREMID